MAVTPSVSPTVKGTMPVVATESVVAMVSEAVIIAGTTTIGRRCPSVATVTAGAVTCNTTGRVIPPLKPRIP